MLQTLFKYRTVTMLAFVDLDVVTPVSSRNPNYTLCSALHHLPVAIMGTICISLAGKYLTNQVISS